MDDILIHTLLRARDSVTMKSLGISLLLVGVLLAALPANAQSSTTFAIKSHDNGGGNYVWQNDAGQSNPTLNVAPGATFTVTATNDDGGTHQLKVGDQTSPDTIDTKGATASVTMTAPQSGTIKYECPLHPTQMVGTITVGTASVTTSTPEKKSPGTQLVGMTIAIVGAALLLAQRKTQ